ncbi:MAG: AmmeMemoRadiSam system protein B [Treponema sp.]|jgi:AmmeMemoRadiSam system protein B|nr:AmmeMemoRadiSam system protein B [Treponema sp.]
MREIRSSIIEKVRSPVVAGLFYPEERNDAAAALCSYGLEHGVGGRAKALIAPHGAWEFSGSIAAAAFAAAAGRAVMGGVSRVAILGPGHHYAEEGLFLSDSGCFDTPLGRLPVDRRLCSGLASCSTLFEYNDIPHLDESSIEVLLPFIRFCFPGAAIIPVLMCGSQPRLISALARAMKIAFEPELEELLLVVSSNLSVDRDEETALARAQRCRRLLEAGDRDRFGRGIADGSISACGAPLIAALLESGLYEGAAARSLREPLVMAKAERGNTTYYGAIAFE